MLLEAEHPVSNVFDNCGKKRQKLMIAEAILSAIKIFFSIYLGSNLIQFLLTLVESL